MPWSKEDGQEDSSIFSNLTLFKKFVFIIKLLKNKKLTKENNYK